MFRFVILGAMLVAAAMAEVNVGSQCSQISGELPASFQVQGCTSTPCRLPQLEEAVFKVRFNAPQDSEALRAQLTVYLFGPLSIRYDLGPSNEACNGLENASCPVKEGQELDYTLKIPIEAYFLVGTSVPLELSVWDDVGSPAFCARVPIQITEPKTLDTIRVVN